MKIDRRSFLSLGIGAAAGTALTPIPWKMMDDSAIWTQNWWLTPVPASGEVSYKTTACTLCSGGCGIKIRMVENRAVKVEGLENHPVNDGGICPIGLSAIQLLYGGTRVKTPLKKVNGRFVKISWKDAISEIALKLKELREQGNAHKLSCLTGSDKNATSLLLKRFINAVGSNNFFADTTVSDSYELMIKKVHNTDGSIAFDLENSDFILSFGSGIIDGFASPLKMIRANSKIKEQGGKFVQIEPRLSNTAAKADKWIPVNPGTEGVLALGLLHVIVKEKLYKESAVSGNITEFNKFKSLIIQTATLNKAAEKTGIDSKTIEKLARSFASAKKPIAIFGRGKGNTPLGFGEAALFYTLNYLAGNINKKGGLFITDNKKINWPEIVKDEITSTGLDKSRMDGAGVGAFEDTKYITHRLTNLLNSKNQNSIAALFIYNENPCYTLSDSKKINKAIDSVPLAVSFSSYLDETALKADYVLPNHTNLERLQDIPFVSGITGELVNLSKPVVKPMYDTKNTGDVIISLAKTMGGSIAESFAWNSFEACLKSTFKDKWRKLDKEGFWFNPQKDITTCPDLDFSKLLNINLDNTQPQGSKSKFPLILIPKESIRISSGYIADPPFAVKSIPDTVLKNNDQVIEINPETAKKYGLKNTKYATLTTPLGEIKVKIHVYNGIMEGVVAMSKGLGHIGYDKFISGKGENFNQLIGPVEDPDSGFDVAWGIRAKLTRA